VEGDHLGARAVRRGQDAGDLARVLRIDDGGPREDPDVGEEAIVDLGPVLDVVAVADRQVADLQASVTPWVPCKMYQRVIESCTEESITKVFGGVCRARWKWMG
jgi:hypothetical protein